MVLVAVIATSTSFSDAEDTTRTTTQKHATRNKLTVSESYSRYLKDSEFKFTGEDETTDEEEERISSILNKLKNVFHQKPNLASSLSKHSALAKAVEKNTDPMYRKVFRSVRSFFARHPTLTRGIKRATQVIDIIVIVSLLVLFAMAIQQSVNNKN
ncbi:Avirulence (Avh) protein [Phytophthora megakarya]|uniref:Avirulence (Avh) protein n=1 Tax=Phytophthora megakarya TaxID=4795 RepID=A0A225UVL1_9STRA|nr:Avirulence (Avh) protein [Phytophthora megakarya]